MSSRFFRSLFAGCVLLVPLGSPALAAAAEGDMSSLTLQDAERLALERDPVLRRFQSLATAMQEQAVADAQLPDPRLRFGVDGLPTDTFSLRQEEMTQLQVGVMQDFPRGRSRALRSEQSRALGVSEEARAADQARSVLRGVRSSYLEAYYQYQAQETIRRNRALFERLVRITESQYATGRGFQQDVLRARLELALLDNRLTSAAAEEAVARAELGKWVGSGTAQQPLRKMPVLAALPERSVMDERLLAHPMLEAEAAMVAASQNEVELARQAYKPGWGLELGYGVRFGENPEGESRADLLTAMVTMDLPLFSDKRQDRRLAASQQQALATRYAREDRLRELQAELAREYATWLRLDEQVERYRREIVPRSTQTAAATLSAYQSRTVDFATLVRAQLDEIENRLEAQRAEVDRAKAQADLLYLVGETP